MKKLFTLLLAIVVSIGIMNAVTINGLNYNLDATNLTAEVARNDGASGDIIIPATVIYDAQTYSVSSIGDDAFFVCSGLTSVVIPNSVTCIGSWAFAYCSGLTSVTIPSSVTSIEGYAFMGCSGLTSVTIPNSVTSIGTTAFRDCSGLTSIVWNAVNCNNNGYFGSQVTSFVLGDQVKTIPNYCCSGMNLLTAITIPNSVTSIGEWAFEDCSGLTSVTNNSITPQQINSNVFNNVDKSACTLYVPKESVDLYKAADVWKEFTNIVGVDVPEEPEEPIETIESDYTIYYVDKDSQDLIDEVVTLHVPVAPVIEGFTFVRWQAFADNIEDGITIQAIYTANTPTSAPAVYTNPANPAQKLIKNGNVYILTDDKTYTITGQLAK